MTVDTTRDLNTRASTFWRTELDRALAERRASPDNLMYPETNNLILKECDPELERLSQLAGKEAMDDFIPEIREMKRKRAAAVAIAKGRAKTQQAQALRSRRGLLALRLGMIDRGIERLTPQQRLTLGLADRGLTTHHH